MKWHGQDILRHLARASFMVVGYVRGVDPSRCIVDENGKGAVTYDERALSFPFQ